MFADVKSVTTVTPLAASARFISPGGGRCVFSVQERAPPGFEVAAGYGKVRPTTLSSMGAQTMSAKSDRDNRSNQLNPNNDAYWDSRRQADDSDDGGSTVSRADLIRQAFQRSFQPDTPDLPEWLDGEYFMAIVAFDGRTRHVRFKTRVRDDIFRRPASGVVESVWDVQLRWMAQDCKLGIAYARIAGSWNGTRLHRFIWNSPTVTEDGLEALLFGGGQLSDDIARAKAWYSSVRDLANKFETVFECGDHAGSEDLGVLTEEIDFDTPNPYDDFRVKANLGIR